MRTSQLAALCSAVVLLSVSATCQMKSTAPDTLLRDARTSLGIDRRTKVFDVRTSVEGGTLTLKGEIQDAALRESLLRFLRSRWQGSITDSLTMMAPASPGMKPWAVTSISVANIRTRPEHSEEMATQVLMGSPLRVVKSDSGWLRVQTLEDYLGWTDDLVVLMSDSEYRAWTEKPKVIVTATYGFTHQEPGEESQVVSDIVVGDILWMKGEHGGYYEVGYPDGRTAYLRAGDAMLLPEWISQRKPSPENVVATAKKFFGVPYMWGGTSSKALDCSGFTKTVYYLNGILLPRDADQQGDVGDAVDTSDNFSHLRAGDLLFFGRKATAQRRERISHVGISLGGPRYIHESGDVHFNSLDPSDRDFSDFRRKGLVRVRRILGSANGLRFLKDLSYFQSHGL